MIADGELEATKAVRIYYGELQAGHAAEAFKADPCQQIRNPYRNQHHACGLTGLCRERELLFWAIGKPTGIGA